MKNARITYNMTKSGWNPEVQNHFTTSITDEAFAEITEELRVDGWSMAMACQAGVEMIKVVSALAKLQGFHKVTSWCIEEITVND